jgi:hypothetical protein
MVNVVSFCLYGPEQAKYYHGLLENIFLLGNFFPTWKVYVYCAPDVTENMVNHLKACTSVVLRHTGVYGPINMIHRFYAIDEPEVDLMMVRDADSRVHWKDRWAIRAFARQPQFIAHTIRDNIEHTAAMMGGLWGIRKSSGLNMHHEYTHYVEDQSKGHRQGHDQNFLGDVIYPKVVARMLVHYSNKRRKVGETAVEFPFDWSNDFYCGRVEDPAKYVDHPEPPAKQVVTSSLFPQAVVRVRDVSPALVAAPAPAPAPLPLFRFKPTPNVLPFLHRA